MSPGATKGHFCTIETTSHCWGNRKEQQGTVITILFAIIINANEMGVVQPASTPQTQKQQTLPSTADNSIMYMYIHSIQQWATGCDEMSVCP